MLLSKGFEVEMYTGTPQGENVGLSDRIVADLEGFTREPDTRNVEYTTPPLSSYDKLLCALVRPRQKLREYLKKLGDYTLIPGSTLSLAGSDRFYRSDPNNPYHSFIEQSYGSSVVTASIHINIGIANPELLMQAIRLIRLEAPLYLALSASSPFLDGRVTGSLSTRWTLFPKTPPSVPLFESHGHFIEWTKEQLEAGTIQNVRHLWCSVRPNGDRRPYNLNRLELRICDFVASPIAQLALVAFLEARLWQLFENPSLDPFESSLLPASTLVEDLLAIADSNEMAAARDGLEAQLRHWQDGRVITAKDWIEEIYEQVLPLARQRGFSCFLSPLKKILRQGNEAQKWLKQSEEGVDVRSIMTSAITDMEQQELELSDKLCPPLVA